MWIYFSLNKTEFTGGIASPRLSEGQEVSKYLKIVRRTVVDESSTLAFLLCFDPRIKKQKPRSGRQCAGGIREGDEATSAAIHLEQFPDCHDTSG